MGKVTNIRLPNGFSISCESDDAGVPDITQNAGENVMKAQDDAQKPVTQDAAEYDAAAEADTKSETEDVQDVASQESFLGLTIARRAQEGFGLKKAKEGYKSIDAFLKSPEAKAAAATAKAWVSKSKLEIASQKDVREGSTSFKAKLTGINKDFAKKNSVGKFYTAFGLTFFGWDYDDGFGKKHFTVALMLKKKNGDITFKYFVIGAKITVPRSNEDVGLESLNRFFGFESDDAAEETSEAPAETSDTNPAITTEEPAAETEAPAEDDEDSPEVNVEAELKEEEEETEAAAEEPAAETEAPAEKETSSKAEADDDEKAIENFFANWGL